MTPTPSTLNLGNRGTIVYKGHAGFFVSTALTAKLASIEAVLVHELCRGFRARAQFQVEGLELRVWASGSGPRVWALWA